MNSLLSLRSLGTALLLATLSLPAMAQSVVGKGKTGPAPDPVNLDITGLFQAKFASVGSDLFIAGQPTEKALRELKAKGVTTVINLRMPEEMKQIGFDEAGLVQELGMNYVHIPMRGSAENPYGPKQLDQFAAAIAAADGKVLLHCTVAWRASHIWAAYLMRDRGVPAATAIAQTRSINLRDEAPFGGLQPIEGFLGKPIPELAKPK